MKQGKIVIALLLMGTAASSIYLLASDSRVKKPTPLKDCCAPKEEETLKINSSSEQKHEGCVFKTVFEGDYNVKEFEYATPDNVKVSIDNALKWVVKEQYQDGSWYGGYHASQNVLNDPNGKGDPATTSMVAMALLRCGHTPFKGEFSSNLNKATQFLLKAVETSKADAPNITSITGTQPQIKLGQNIDVMLTSQYLTNLVTHYNQDSAMLKRIKNSITVCIKKIQNVQDNNGSFKGAGWAGVLQSSVANNALESAKSIGIKVDSTVLRKSREYQKDNYDANTGNVSTADGAGVMLYAISSTSRASAKEALVAKKALKKAKAEGKLSNDTVMSVENLEKAGFSNNEAVKYNTAFMVNSSSNKLAQSNAVMTGFGSNGGEEFYSYLQTGEGLIISHDTTWRNWYTNVSNKLVSLQLKEGNWQGHHCITSPVFCTATCLLILSVNRDVERLLAMEN